ncbi:MAG: two-component regulator propeller domain-containing protein [Bacteroidota bacterium]
MFRRKTTPYAKRVLCLIILALLFHLPTFAQSSESWKSLTSFNTINDLTQSSDGMIWGVTDGGLFSFRDSTFQSTFTPVEGMHRLDGFEIEYLESSNQIIIGYIDGMLDLFDIETESFQQVEDIFRVQGFTSKRINDFLVLDDELFVATQFGIVVYDLNTFLVSNSYTRLGSFDRGTTVNDLYIEDDTLIAGTQQGVAVADMSQNLNIKENWQVYIQGEDLPSGSIQSVIIFNGSYFASSSNANFIFEGGEWQNNDIFGNYTDLTYSGITESGTLITYTSQRILSLDPGGNLQITNPGLQSVSGVIFDETLTNTVYAATLTSGMGLAEPGSNNYATVTRDGPNLNFFDGMTIGDGLFLSGTSRQSQLSGLLDNPKGYYVRDESGWQNYNRTNNTTLNQNQFRQAFTTTYTDEYYYIGSWGRGIARHNRDTNEIDVFNASNSTLRGWAADDPNFPVISGLDTDSDGTVWATSRLATQPLYAQLPGEDEWINYSKSAAVNSNDEYDKLFIDSIGQKWITLTSVGGGGRGLLVVDTGETAQTEESSGVKLTDDPNSGNLPDMSVTSVIEDKDGEVWVGTERGIARYIFPQFIVTGTQEERRGQWLLNDDPDAPSPFLLRDINVSAMAVNSANQKWVGTAGEGVWLLNESGSQILEQFNSSNSPLFSNVIRDIEVDEQTGEVYISTDRGLIIYSGVPNEPAASMNELKVYPNPFLYDRHDIIQIENLSDISTIRILGVDGNLIRTIESRGGRVTWDGLDSRGREVGSGVYIVVALNEGGDERGFGKVAIIR